MKRVPIPRRRLMDAARQATIARELIAVAPDAPWFLWNMLPGATMASTLGVDFPSGRPLALDPSASNLPEGAPK